MSMHHQFTAFFALLLIALCPYPSFGQGKDKTMGISDPLLLWHPIPLEEESRFLFVAFEEAAFARERLGRWLPNRFLPIEPGDECFWALRTATLQGKKMLVHISIWNKTQDLRNEAYWSYTMNSAQRSVNAREPRVVYLSKNTGFAIEFPENGESRQVCFLPAASVEEAKEKFSISKSSVMWDWLVFTW